MLLFLLACSEPPEPGVLYDGQRLPVVDMHLHSGDWEGVPSGTQSFIARNFPFPFNLDPETTAKSTLSAEGIVEQLDIAAISHGVVFAVYAPRSVGVASNETISAQVAEAPGRLWGLASLPIESWETGEEAALAQLEAALQEPGMVGIKLAHTHMHQRMDDPDYYSIYALAAAQGAPLYLHTGSSPFPGTQPDPAYTDPRYLEEAIALHPDADFILGHACYDFINEDTLDLDSCVDLARRYPNVYIEISALGSSSSDARAEDYPVVLDRLRSEGLTERVIYGSDGPQRPGFLLAYLERTVSVMEEVGYTDAEARAVLSDNFTALFGLDAVTL